VEHGKKVFVALFVVLISQTSFASIPDLMLGQEGLEQKVTNNKLANGVIYYDVKRGYPSTSHYFLPSSAVLGQDEANFLISHLSTLGFESEIVEIPEGGPFGEHLGYLVHTGSFARREEAEATRKSLKEKGLSFKLRFSEEEGFSSSGPFHLGILKIDLKEPTLRLEANLPNGKIVGKGLLSNYANEVGAIAGVNGGFFAWNDRVGIPGDLAGIFVHNGNLISEASRNRSALMLRSHNKVTQADVLQGVSSSILVNTNEKAFVATGINRGPGKVLNCGIPSNDYSLRPIHDHVCMVSEEIVVYTIEFNDHIELEAGVVVRVGSEDKIKAITTIVDLKSFPIDNNSYLIYFEKQSFEDLELSLGQTVTYETVVQTGSHNVLLDENTYIIGGGPTLLDSGNVPFALRAHEGFGVNFDRIDFSQQFTGKADDLGVSADQKSRNSFYHAWVLRRHPRTAAKITSDNKLIFVVIYGRQLFVTAGATITEMAIVHKQLGAIEAVNLDGGGSSSMYVKGHITGTPSDRTGERPIVDVITLKIKQGS